MLALFIIGFLGFVAGLIWLIVALIKRAGKRVPLAVLGIGLVLFIVGAAGSSHEQHQEVPTRQAAEKSEITPSPQLAPTTPAAPDSLLQVPPPTSKAVPTPSQALTSKMQLTNENWNLVLSEAQGAQKAYIGSPVILIGKVEQVMGRTTNETWIAIDTNFEEVTFGQITAVVIRRDLNVKEGNWVKVQGVLASYWTTQNIIGIELRVPIVIADNILIVSRSEAIPPIVTVNVGKTVAQQGLSITLEKVEIAVSETRVFVKASNDSTGKASLYSYDAVLVQGQKQIKVKVLLGESDVEQPDTTLVSGTVTNGIIMFEPLDPNVRQAKLIWSSPGTDDWQFQFSDWIWEFNW